MPPDVGRTGSGTSVPHTPSSEGQKVESKGTTTTKSTSDSATQAKKDDQDPKAAAKATQGARQNAGELKSHNHRRAQDVKENLQKQIPVIDASGLKKGESISARVDNKPDGFHFDFERPITKEQAGAIIFHKGKVPERASLEGSGKNWVVKVPNSVEERQKTVAQFTKHTETTKPPEKRPNDVYPSDRELKFKWVGGDLLTNEQRMQQLMEEQDKKIKDVMNSLRG